MYAIIASPLFAEEIKDVINARSEEILYKKIDTEIDIDDELEKISRLAIKHLIIDITSLYDEIKLSSAIRKYRIKKESTQIIILAPNYIPGNETLSLLVSMGVYDIIAPQGELEEIKITPYLAEVLDKPTPYARAVRWDIGVEVNNDTSKNEKVKVKIEYRDRIESVFKKVITVYSPTGEGTSTIAAHLAYTLASNKECKVGLLDFEIFNPIQRELFDINPSFTLKDALDAVIKKTLTPAVLENFMKNNKVSKNLDILAGLYDINEFYSSQQIYFKEIIEKAKFTYDYIVIDTNSLYDLYPTNIALEMADDVIVPLRGRKHSINTVNRYLSNFNEYNDYDIRKFHLVVNKYSGNDLTSIEIQSQAIRPIIGYISYNKNYDKLTLLNDTKTINEYIDVLNEIGIKIKKKRNIFKSIVGRQKG